MSCLTDHADDLFRRAEYEVAASAFLSPAEQREIFDALPAARARLVFFGGALGCERRCAFFVPDWMLDAAGIAGLGSLSAFSDERETAAAALDADGSLTADRIAVAEIEGSGFAALRHRDFMGAILNLGIKRETLGDIVVRDSRSAAAYCLPAAATVIAGELERIGRDGVRVSVRGVRSDERVEREYEERVVTVASMRLDCVVSELANVSRESAKRLIASGAVELDHRESADADERVAEGATVSVRGAGKYRIGETLGETRSARLRLRVLRYV